MTGLRRSELASLRPSSFQLENPVPTLTIEATVSKHRREDVLPIHPDLVPIIRTWLTGLALDQVLFPKLKTRKTCQMVKTDLKDSGIPYRTSEGDADFHAIGRHSHITQLVLSGAPLAIAKELARHSDLATTMAYTHIGLSHQAEALGQLSLPRQYNVSEPAVPECPETDSDDEQGHANDIFEDAANPNQKATCDDECSQVALTDAESEKWRRRGSNPRPEMFSRRLLHA